MASVPLIPSVMEDEDSIKPSTLAAVHTINAPSKCPSSLRNLRDTWRAYTKGTVLSSIFTLLTTSIGAGTLSLPYAFSRGGLVPASILFFMIMVISIVVGFMLFSGKRYCAELFPRMEVWGYEDLAQAAFGAVGKVAVLLTLIILLFLSLIAYMIYTRDQLEQIMRFALSKSGHVGDCSPLVNCALLVTMAFIPLFPVTLLKDLTPMQITSTASILCIGYVAIVMVIKTSLAWSQYLTHTNHTHTSDSIPPKHDAAIWRGESHPFTGVLTTISYCSLAFVCHFNILPLQKELRNPTKTRLNIIIIGSLVTAYVLYNVVIFSSYFNFFGSVKEDIMLNYPHDDVLVTTARIALFFTLLFSYPVLLHPTRASINSLIFFLHSIFGKMVQMTWIAGNVGKEEEDEEPLLSSTSQRQRQNKVGYVWNFVGSIGGTLILYIFPAAFYLRLHYLRYVHRARVEVPMLVWICETWIIFAASFLPASFIPNVGYVWNFVGSIGGTLILYIFPAAFYLRLRYLRYVHRARQLGITICSQYDWYAFYKEAVAWAIMILGGLLLIVENYQAIDAIVSASHAPSTLCHQLDCHTLASMSPLNDSSPINI